MKSSWLIETPSVKFIAYRETLKALGYEIHQFTQEASINNRKFIGLLNKWSDQTVQRVDSGEPGVAVFSNMESFLDYHFKEKSREEKELDKLNQQLVELQAQINVVKQSINK